MTALKVLEGSNNVSKKYCAVKSILYNMITLIDRLSLTQSHSSLPGDTHTCNNIVYNKYTLWRRDTMYVCCIYFIILLFPFPVFNSTYPMQCESIYIYIYNALPSSPWIPSYYTGNFKFNFIPISPLRLLTAAIYRIKLKLVQLSEIQIHLTGT